MYRCIVLGLSLLLVFGCGGDTSKDQPILLDQVPASIRKVADDKLPNIKFDQATKRSDGGYEIRGKDKNGKVRDIDLTLDGKVIEIE